MNLTNKSKGIQFFDDENFNLVLNCYEIVGSGYDYKGFQDLQYLYKLNEMFSNSPWGNIIDRSNSTKYPFKLHIRMPWLEPNKLNKNLDLETVCNIRVKQIINQYPAPYNLFWSGGIDSTLLVVSFMKLVDHKNLIIHLTSSSIKENEYFFKKIIKPNLKITYNNNTISNIGSNITGECGDTIWAALDHGFFLNEPIKNYIYKPWQEWFKIKNNNEIFLNFAEKFMKKAGRPIITLFDARWWFYLLCKSQSKATLLQMTTFHNSITIPFYESTDIETWAWHNLENMIKGNDWQTYKWPAKEIIYKVDKNKDYLKYKTKEYSLDLHNTSVRSLKIDKPLFLTDNLEKPILSTDPFFSKEAYKQEFYEKYKHLFVV